MRTSLASNEFDPFAPPAAAIVEDSVEFSPVERCLVEAIARLVPKFMAAAVRAEQKAEPEVIGFGEPDK